MADQQRIQLAREGAETWNSWRVASPNQSIDLEDLNLAGAYLALAQLQDAVFKGLTLQEAMLDGASLESVLFEHVNLQRASVQHAGLLESMIQLSNGSEASFSFSHLVGIHLGQFNMQRANFRVRDDVRIIFARGRFPLGESLP